MSRAVAEEFREERRREKVKRKREGTKRRTEEEKMCRTKMKLRRTVMQHFGCQWPLNLIKKKDAVVVDLF